MTVHSDRSTLDTTIDPVTGMQKDYFVLSEEERSRGFVRPVRPTYVHVGVAGPKHPTRPLTPEERESYGNQFAAFETYPESLRPATGRFWTQKELESIGKGCGAATTMNQAIAETYAREPSIYSGTFCSVCRKHFPVGEDGEFVWEGTTLRVGT